jgi:hypothetical protein
LEHESKDWKGASNEDIPLTWMNFKDVFPAA